MARSAARVQQAGFGAPPELATIENGLVFLEEALGSPIHLAELITFPAARDDDQIDSTAEKVGQYAAYSSSSIRLGPFFIKEDLQFNIRRKSFGGALEGLDAFGEVEGASDHRFQIHFAGRYQLKCALIDVGVAKHRLNSDFLGYRRRNVEADLFHRQPHQYDSAARPRRREQIGINLCAAASLEQDVDAPTSCIL